MGHRTANWLVVIALLLAALSPLHARAATQAPVANATATRVLTASNFQRAGRVVVVNALKAQSGDTYPTTTLAPSVGILYLQRSDGDIEQCTGVVVGDHQILTAAHCVCGRPDTNPGYESFAACKASLATVSGRFFSPISGFSTLRGAPIVHPNYRFPDPNAPSITTTAVFDAAIVQTKDAITAPPARISRDPPTSTRYLFAAIGPYAEYAGARSAKRYDHNYPLASKATLLQPARFGAACGEQPAPDTLCVRYDAIDIALPSERSVSACPADSGGGLFGFDNGQLGPLMGLASYVFPPHPISGCIASKSQRTYFLDLSKGGLRDWIVGLVGEPVSTAPGATCDDAMIYGPGKPDIAVAANTIAVAGLQSLSIISNDEAFTFQVLEGPNVRCEGTTSISHCRITAGPAPAVYVYGRSVQLTACWK